LLALIEGDAEVAMAAYIGAEYGSPIRRTLRSVTDVTKTISVDEMARAEQKTSDKLAKALRITRARLEFPYLEGMRFVADIYRAGGFPLVDAMYDAPPVSTAQILHPEKYIAGALPAEVLEPEPPRGFQLITSERLGELQTRITLAGCATEEAATRAASGWAGDRFSVVVDDAKQLGVLWSTVWESPADALEFASIVEKPACWSSNELGGGRGYRVGDGFTVAREGTNVAFARGFDATTRGALTKQLLGLSRPPPVARSRGDYRIPPREPLPEPVRGSVRDGVFRSDWLGLHGRVPPGLATATDHQDLELFLERNDTLVVGALVVSDRMTTQRFNEIAFDEIGKSFATLVHRTAIPVSWGESRVSLGAATERTWRIADTSAEIRAVMVPVCAGTGSLVFIEAYADSYARAVLDGWVNSFQWLNGRNLPICARLDPK
jgi:hypothetical protein